MTAATITTKTMIAAIAVVLMTRLQFQCDSVDPKTMERKFPAELVEATRRAITLPVPVNLPEDIT